MPNCGIRPRCPDPRYTFTYERRFRDHLAGRFEIGAGPLIGYADASASDLEGTEVDVQGFGFTGVTSTIGYRCHPQDGGFLFRIGLTPSSSGSPQIRGGISIGYTF